MENPELILPSQYEDLYNTKPLDPTDYVSTTVFRLMPGTSFFGPFLALRQPGENTFVLKAVNFLTMWSRTKLVIEVELSHVQNGQRTAFRAVCKFAWADKVEMLEDEMKNYESLKTFQGRHIPQVYGCFEGVTDNGNAKCLVMSYEGTGLLDKADGFWQLNKPVRYVSVFLDGFVSDSADECR